MISIQMKTVAALALTLLATQGAAAADLPVYDLYCNEVINDSLPDGTVVENDLREVIKTRAITQKDIDDGLATPDFLGASYAKKEFNMGGIEITTKVFGGHPSLVMLLPDGNMIFDGHNDGKYSQLGVFLNDQKTASIHTVSCLLTRRN